MSQGTNPERLSQNNELLIANNEELVNLETLVNTLPQALDTSNATAIAEDIRAGVTAYVKGELITGTAYEVPTGSEVTLFTTDSDNIVNVSDTQTKIISDPIEITSHVAKGASLGITLENDILASSIGLKADILASGNTILGITGTNIGLDTSDATATKNDIVEGLTAYIKGEKVIGTLPLHTGISIQSTNTTQIESENRIYFNYTTSDRILVEANNTIDMSASYDSIVDAIGLIPGMLVEGNTILGVQGTATELEVTKTEIWDTTNNNIIVGLDDLELYKDQGVIGFRVNVPSSITNKDQILLSGTGYIELQSQVLGTGCLCARLSGIEELDSYFASDGEYVVIIDESNTYLGTYYYTASTWSEVVSPTAYDKTLTENEYAEAVNTSEQILGEENI